MIEYMIYKIGEMFKKKLPQRKSHVIMFIGEFSWDVYVPAE